MSLLLVFVDVVEERRRQRVTLLGQIAVLIVLIFLGQIIQNSLRLFVPKTGLQY